MSISSSVSRVADYFKRNGLRATVLRIRLATRRALFSSRSVVFYCDLATLKLASTELPNSLKVERHSNQSGISPADLQEIINVWNPDQTRRNLKERFGLGSSLWLIKVQDHLAGYGWTLQGRTVEPHYFALAPDDVQFLDFHVFAKYRGRALDWFLMTHILHTLAAEGRARAFGEAAEWNKASLSSFGMTPFHRLGLARKFTVLGRTLVHWSAEQPASQPQRTRAKLPRSASQARPSQEKA